MTARRCTSITRQVAVFPRCGNEQNNMVDLVPLHNKAGRAGERQSPLTSKFKRELNHIKLIVKDCIPMCKRSVVRDTEQHGTRITIMNMRSLVNGD